MVAPLLDAVHRRGYTRLVTFGQEQPAAFAADAAARLAGRPRVVLGTVGPGALNLANGVASAWCDSVPMVVLVGQVQSYLRRNRPPLRQVGFQEVDFPAVIRPLVKAAWSVSRPALAADTVRAAFELALAQRQGPVVVELPFDVQAAPVTRMEPFERPTTGPLTEDVGAATARIAEALSVARRPVVLAGAGVASAGVRHDVLDLVERSDLPLLTTLHALDLIPAEHPLAAGMPGPFGHRRANLLLAESDLVLVLGARLDHGQTGADTGWFSKGRHVLRVDADPEELRHRGRAVEGFCADLARIVPELVRRTLPCTRPGWRERVRQLALDHPVHAELGRVAGLNPHEVVSRVVDTAPADAAVVVDLGQHTWWAAQAARLRRDQRFLAATGLGCMGYSAGAAIGAALEGRPVVSFVGDGALLMNIQELETLRRLALDVLVVVLDNGVHGMVREFQARTYAGRTPASEEGYSRPDFTRVARAFDVPARTVATRRALSAAVAWAADQRGPRLLRARIGADVPVTPAVDYGRPLNRMSPPFNPDD